MWAEGGLLGRSLESECGSWEREGGEEVRAYISREVKMCKACWGSKGKPVADTLCIDTSGWKIVARWEKQTEARLWKDSLKNIFRN